MTSVVNVVIICFCLSIVAGLVIQIKSILRLMRFLKTPKEEKICLCMVACLLSIIYMHEVIAMLSIYWAYPAMDVCTYDNGGIYLKIINYYIV